MARVLVVDDDVTVAEVVVAYLERAGLAAEHAADGPTALEAAAARPPDAVVLDVMLPGLDGIEVCRRLRAVRPGLPVLMLTARGEEEDRILGLEVGADDYVTKPFSPRELVLRVRSLLRRALPDPDPRATPDGDPGHVLPSGTLRDGDLVLDATAHRVLRDDRELQLTVREFDLLHYFLAHPGQVHDRETLLREVWGWEFGDRSTVTVHVRRLREKVEADPSHPTRLVTVFGVGYRWDASVPARTQAQVGAP
ncbi:response regulator transcription factor [Antribacter sp. KLBMP9083]|uniref:Response regulator transcription factor n=1 Tax=Antribacter soli TaxID=2910976 RepID=A0AA41QH87_9MICO|nr:response regulator transcription factor [Antribacter soli]MCF4119668.1 response regulator transcription factor [Antribacter soli]MCF4123430.1 response regulator transcription factor [Antribacter soli]